MQHDPIPAVGDGMDHNPIIGEVVSALRRAGATDRESAALQLLTYEHTDQLTQREVEAVLQRFPESTGDIR